MRPELGPKECVEFHKEWGMRRPIFGGGNDWQKTQGHAAFMNMPMRGKEQED